MTPNIESLNHTPNTSVSVELAHDNGDTERIRVCIAKTRVNAVYNYYPDEELMSDWDRDVTTRHDDRDDVHDKINDVLGSINTADGVHRTLERLRRIGHWMDKQDPTLPDDVRVDVRGPYKPFRDQDLLLVQSDRPLPSGHRRAFVKVADELPSVDELRDQFDDTLEKRAKRNMSGQQRTHYEENLERIRTGQIRHVESLDEADVLAYGDDTADDEEEKETENYDEQTTFAGF